MLANDSRSILPEPSGELKQLSGRLSERIRARIEEEGPLPFSTYMEMALYEPGLGYYSAGLRKFGVGGDFVTAPELGTVFADCLARQVEELGDRLGDYLILEIGAGNGSLAADLLQALAAAGPERYFILERSAHLRQVQRETLERQAPGLLACVGWLDAPPAEPWQGLVIANEVIDALPVERFHVSREGLQQMLVKASGMDFDWATGPPPQALSAAIESTLGEKLGHLPEGYSSEINPRLGPWLESVTCNLERGCALFMDYGYPRGEYYLPERRTGTLVCHYRHRAVEDPFRWPGLQDLSAFVDFTALAEAGRDLGLDCAGYTSQAMFLFGCGLEGLLQDAARLPDRERLQFTSEVRELTLPGAMGEKFQVMALARGLDQPMRGFMQLDLRYRL
jgi:SAM-dependent MidA family methyltransferase